MFVRVFAALIAAAMTGCPAARMVAPAPEPAPAAEATMSEVVPLAPGEDPFRALAPPALEPSEGPVEALRLGPVPPPQPGEIAQVFPPPEPPGGPRPVVAAPPLRVVRAQPTGSVELQSAVVVTFNQPMVPLASVGELKDAPSPLVIDPLPAGKFRWVDPQTLAFEVTDRLPYATRYRARVPAGTRSAAGQLLASEYAWTFETPAPKVEQVLPGEDSADARPDTAIRIFFNTAMDPKIAAPAITLKAGAGRAIAADVAAGDEASAGGWPAQRVLVLRPKSPLALATTYTVSVAKGLLSAEGPTRGEAAWSAKFSTYAPLKVAELRCGWQYDSECQPGDTITIEFNNPLAPRQRPASFVTIAPAIESPVFQVHGQQISVVGPFAPATKYSVRVTPGLEDVYGQKLAAGASGTVKFGAVPAMLELSTREPVTVLEAQLPPLLPAVAVNVKSGTLRMSRIDAADVRGWWDVVRSASYDSRERSIFSGRKPQVSRPISLAPTPNHYSAVSVDLREVLPSGRGLAAVEVEAPLGEDWRGPRRVAFALVTDLGVTAAMSNEQAHVLVTSLKDARAVANAEVAFTTRDGGFEPSVRTDARGMAVVPVPRDLKRSGSELLVVRTADDFALVDAARMQVGAVSFEPSTRPVVLGHAFLDRDVYRPGETAHVSFIARARTPGPAGQLSSLGAGLAPLSVEVFSPDSKAILTQKVAPSAFGTGSFDVAIPKDGALGRYLVRVTAADGSDAFETTFETKEFRTPEFKVAVERADAGGDLLLGKTVPVTVRGEFLFGARMAGAGVKWRLLREPVAFEPARNEGFQFGPPPRWRGRRWRGPESIAQGGGRLGSRGSLSIPAVLADPGLEESAYSFTLEGEVIDTNRQAVAGRTAFMAHRTSRLVGVRVDRAVVKAGESVGIEAVIVGLDGRRLAGVPFEVVLLEERAISDGEPDEADTFDAGDGRTRKVEAGRCTPTSAEGPVSCRIDVARAGAYELVARVRDGDRQHESSLRLWAFGAGESPWRGSADARVELVPDRTTYEPGQTARVLVNSPFKSARGFLLLSREGFAEVRPLELTSGSTLLEVPIAEAWLPQVHARVVLVSGRRSEPDEDGVDPGRPLFAAGERELSISREHQRIRIAIEPERAVAAPGSELSVEVKTFDADGKPIAANVAFMVVDEGVLSLTGYTTPNPLEELYRPLSPATGVADLRPSILPRERARLALGQVIGGGAGAFARGRGGGAGMMKSTMAADGSAPESGGESPSLAVRSVFETTPCFEGALVTDADGRARTTFKLPDNLTEFRLMAIAADGARRFGAADARLPVRQALMIRPSLPRFVNVGDRFEAAAVVNNETGADTEVMVRLLTVNAKLGATTQTIRVRSGDSKEVRFAVEAGAPGPSKYQFAAVALTKERPTDAAEIVVPTLLPATAEATAVYGSTESSVRQPLAPPRDALPGFGGLDVQLSSTALNGLQDAARYLVEYPYECAEQTASLLVPLVALRELLPAFEIGGAASAQERDRLVKVKLGRLASLQRADGGFGFWEESPRSELYLSAWIAFVLRAAAEALEPVDPRMLSRLEEFVAARLAQPVDEWEAKDGSARALALLALAQAGRVPAAELVALGDGASLPMFAQAWLLETWHLANHPLSAGMKARIHTRISNAAVESAGALHFAEHRTEALRLLLHSDDRTDAILLRALLRVAPDDPRIEKLQRGVMRSRVKGRWSTTQANAWALLAMRDYVRQFEAAEPAFTARAWVGDTYAGGREFVGRELTLARVQVPLDALLAKPVDDVVIGKDGPGRLYYRLALRHAPSNLRLAPEEAGFAVTRSYEGVDDPSDVTRAADGSWRVKAGALVRIRLGIAVPDRRYFVAIVDPMAAGFEPVDTSFATSSTRAASDSSPSRWWRWSPWTHEELRDDRAQAFADSLPAGTYSHSWVARATGLGTFVVPPTRAEEMYAPETFGRGGTDVVVVAP